MNWLKSLAPKESVFIDEDADDEFGKQKHFRDPSGEMLEKK